MQTYKWVKKWPNIYCIVNDIHCMYIHYDSIYHYRAYVLVKNRTQHYNKRFEPKQKFYRTLANAQKAIIAFYEGSILKNVT